MRTGMRPTQIIVPGLLTAIACVPLAVGVVRGSWFAIALALVCLIALVTGVLRARKDN